MDNPIMIIKNDHEEVKTLFKDYENKGTEEKKMIGEKISKALMMHTEMEEKLFYPKVKIISEEANNLIAEAIKEHHEVKKHIREMESAKDEIAMDTHEKMIEEEVMRHVQEEENKILPMAEQNLQEDFQKMAEEMMSFKEQMGNNNE